MSATQLADALRVAGINQRDVDFDKSIAIAIERFIASGGTNEGALMRLQRIVERMSGMGQTANADKGPTSSAQTRQPVEDGGANSAMPQGQKAAAPSSSSNRGGEGQGVIAHQGQFDHALPVREPKPQRVPIDFGAAALAIKTKLALTVLDTLKIDGRAIGDFTVGEARRLGPQKTREGHILIAATRKVANAQGFQLIRDVLKPDELQVIMQKAAEVSDEASA